VTPEDYIGSVGITAAVYAPQNTALCQGQLLPIPQNTALYSLLRTTYGGNGKSNFALPNLAGATSFGVGPQYDTATAWALGQTAPHLTETAWPEGLPAPVAPGGTPTVPVTAGPAGLALNWAIARIGVYPPQPD